MTQLRFLREAMTGFLAEQGIQALSAWPSENRVGYTAPVAVVSLKGFEASSPGFQNYLGEYYDSERQAWTERYGQSVQVRFGLSLYSPRAAGEEGCRNLLDQIADAFQQSGPAGLSLLKWNMGESAYDKSSGMFLAKAEVHCQGMLLARCDEAGEFLRFEVRGGMTT